MQSLLRADPLRLPTIVVRAIGTSGSTATIVTTAAIVITAAATTAGTIRIDVTGIIVTVTIAQIIAIAMTIAGIATVIGTARATIAGITTALTSMCRCITITVGTTSIMGTTASIEIEAVPPSF